MIYARSLANTGLEVIYGRERKEKRSLENPYLYASKLPLHTKYFNKDFDTDEWYLDNFTPDEPRKNKYGRAYKNWNDPKQQKRIHCMRPIVYSAVGIPKHPLCKPNLRTLDNFFRGTMVEFMECSKMARGAEKMGGKFFYQTDPFDDDSIPNELVMPELTKYALPIHGRLDGLLEFDGQRIVYEFKSPKIDSWAFTKGRPRLEYILQLGIYLDALGTADNPVEGSIFIKSGGNAIFSEWHTHLEYKKDGEVKYVELEGMVDGEGERHRIAWWRLVKGIESVKKGVDYLKEHLPGKESILDKVAVLDEIPQSAADGSNPCFKHGGCDSFPCRVKDKQGEVAYICDYHPICYRSEYQEDPLPAMEEVWK